MKKIISVLLMICMLLPLTVSSYAAAVYSAEELEQLKQSAESGDAAAMETLGNLYYLGNYKSGITRDFARALDWFQKAADAGNQNVLMELAAIYEKGSAGEKNIEKAYNYYKKAAEAGIAGADDKIAENQFSQLRWKDSVSLLTGTLGEAVVLHGREAIPFYLDNPVENTTRISLEMRFIDYRGWPFGEYALYALGLDGEWFEITRFQIEKSQAEGEPRTYDFTTETPISFKALSVGLVEDGMDFNLVHEDKYYIDKTCLGQYSDAVPAPVFNPSEKAYPENYAVFVTQAYVNPYPIGG